MADENLDLTPVEERLARGRRRRWLLGVPVGIALCVGLGFAARPTAQAVKGWHSRRLASEALALIERKQWPEAVAKATEAYQLQLSNPQAWRAVAQILSRTGQGAAALEWWPKIEGQGPLTPEDRRDYAGSALLSDELSTASRQVDGLLAQPGGPVPGDLLLAGQLAARGRDGPGALGFAQRLMTDPHAEPGERLAGVALALSITTPDSPAAVNAREHAGRLARDPMNPASLDALVLLTRQPARAPTLPVAPPDGDTLLSLSHGIPPGPAATRWPLVEGFSPTELAVQLETHPGARAYHRMLALELRAQQNPEGAEEYVTRAVEQFGNGDDETLAALSKWLYTRGKFELVLQVLPLDRALQRKDLFLQHIDALGDLGRLREAADLLAGERFPLEPVLQHMYLATIRERLGEEAATRNAWERALEAASTAEGCMALGAYAEQRGAGDIADAAYVRAIAMTPRMRAAHVGRLRLAQTRGQSALEETLLTEILRDWPDDVAAHGDQAYLRLLRGAADAEAKAVEQQAATLVLREPVNGKARGTLALARLRLGRPAEALEAFAAAEPASPSDLPPGASAVRAAVLAANGWREEASTQARQLSAARLRPEERALLSGLTGD